MSIQEPFSAHQETDWQNILWREHRHCRDEVYQQQLLALLVLADVDWSDRWAGRPPAMAVLTALKQGLAALPQVNVVWKQPLVLLEKARRSQTKPQKFIKDLSNHSWVRRFIARHMLVIMGAETVLPLVDFLASRDHPRDLDETIEWLLQSIETHTAEHLGEQPDQSVCLYCLTKCQRYEARYGRRKRLTYYGCRLCQQSRNIWQGTVTTILDVASRKRVIEEENTLRVNWLKKRQLFDFDTVEIINASDEAVERFAVQVGNDTDPTRIARYPAMTCWIDTQAALSENSYRILESRFGSVEVVDLTHE
ncbi:MAG: hypothetical protein AAF485_18255 [Chloroflexota bacterium]